MATGDLDLDGDIDLVQLGEPAGCGRSLLLNRWAAEGRLDFSPSALAAPCPAGIPALLDWDADGDLDVAVAGSSGTPWAFLRNDVRPSGQLSFTDVTATILGGAVIQNGAEDVAVGDLEGDGYPEIMAVGPDGLVLLRNVAGALFVDATVDRALTDEPASTVVITDVNLDGDGDIVLAGEGFVRLYVNEGPGPLLDLGSFSGIAPLADPAAVFAGDLSFDGFPDLFITSKNAAEAPRIFVSRGEISGIPMFDLTFTPPALSSPLAGARPVGMLDSRRLFSVVAVSVSTGIGAALTPAPDADCDGIPDEFEIAFGLNPGDPNNLRSDTDGDQVPQYLEYRFGRVPTSAVSRIDGLRDDGSIQTLMDRDGDNIPDHLDNCVELPNGSQADADSDVIGDLCDPDPFGTDDLVPVSLGVTEYRRVLEAFAIEPQDHRYFGNRDRISGSPEALLGYATFLVPFRWFDDAVPGLVPVYEALVDTGPTGFLHRYVLEADLPGLAANPDTVAVAGYVSQSPAFGTLSTLALLRSFIHPTLGQQVLTADAVRAGTLINQGYLEQPSLGYVLPNSGEHVEAAEAQAYRDGSTQARRYAFRAAEEVAISGYVHEGRAFGVFREPSPLTVPLFRIFDPITRDQLLTTDSAERDLFLFQGYRDEGVLGYVFRQRPAQYHGEVQALHRLRMPGTPAVHAYAAEGTRLEQLLAAGAVPEGIEGWVVVAPAKHPEFRPYACMPAPGTTPPDNAPGRRLVAELSAIVDTETRENSAALALNTLCEMKRIAAGIATHPGEQEMVAAVGPLNPEQKAALVEAGSRLAGISPTQRQQLLGSLISLDPGSCDGTSAPPFLFASIQTPRLRKNSCFDSIVYGGGVDPARAERAVTVSGETVKVSRTFCGTHGCTTATPGDSAPSARPAITGIWGPPVTAHSTLREDWAANRSPDGTQAGDGLSPYGVETTIPCSSTVPCDHTRGLICGLTLNSSARIEMLGGNTYDDGFCYAFPIVRRSEQVEIRGFNFWDQETAHLGFARVSDESNASSFQVTPVPGVDAHEGAPPEAAKICQPPVGKGGASPLNLSHNTASFQPTVSEGFYHNSARNRRGGPDGA